MKIKNKPAKLFAIEPNKLKAEEKETHPTRVEFEYSYRPILFALMIILFCLLILWAWLTELDEITQAPGQIIPEHEVQPVKAAFDSKIEAVYVRPGKFVKKGDLLLKLDVKSYGAELEKYQHELKIIENELAAHEHALKILSDYLVNPKIIPSNLSSITEVAKSIGELYSAEQKLERAKLDMRLNLPSNISKLNIPEFAALKSQHQSVNEQKALKEVALAERTKEFQLEEQKLTSKIDTLGQQLELQKAGVEQRKFSLLCAQKQLKAYEEVFEKGGSSKTECLEAQIRVEDRKKDLTQTEAKEREFMGQLEATRHELSQLKSRNKMQISQLKAGLGDIAASTAQITTRMRSAERALSEAETLDHVCLRAAQSTYANEQITIKNLKQQLAQLNASISSEEHTYKKGDLRSPVDGVVALSHVQGPGEVVQHGQNLLTIVPVNENLVARVYVPNEQIAFLQLGKQVKLQFPAYPYQQYGTVSATVKLIDEFPSDDKEHLNTYKVLLEPKRDWIMCRGKKIKLRKGLELQAQLVLRKKSLLLSILAPIIKLRYIHFKA